MALCALSPGKKEVWKYDGSGTSWTKIGGPATNLYASDFGLYATEPNTGRLLGYNGMPFKWEHLGGPGASFAANSLGLYGISPDKQAVYKWRSGTSWTKIGGPATNLYGGRGILVATRPPNGDLFYFRGADKWERIGEPGASFVVTTDIAPFVYGLTPDKQGVWRWDNSGTSWTKIGGPAANLYGGGWLVATSPNTGNVYRFSGKPFEWKYIGGPGASFVVAHSTSQTVYGLSPDKQGVYQHTGGTSWTKIGGAADSIFVFEHKFPES